ncbi:hypothetical protein Tco_1510974, partial [Tanacetum coccineum]
LLEEFSDVILNVTMVGDEADFNPTKDLEELERLLAKEPQSNFTEIQVDRDIISPGRGITTRRQNLKSLCLIIVSANNNVSSELATQITSCSLDIT